MMTRLTGPIESIESHTIENKSETREYCRLPQMRSQPVTFWNVEVIGWMGSG